MGVAGLFVVGVLDGIAFSSIRGHTCRYVFDFSERIHVPLRICQQPTPFTYRFESVIVIEMAKKNARKNPAAVSLGRKGGKKRAEILSAQELSEQGRKAVQARWAKAAKKKPKGE